MAGRKGRGSGGYHGRDAQGDPFGADPFGTDPFAESPAAGSSLNFTDADLLGDVDFRTDASVVEPQRETLPAEHPRRAVRPRPAKHLRPAGVASYREATYLSTVVIVVAGAVAAGATYLGFAEVRPLSTAPLGNAILFFVIAAVALVACLVAIGVAIRGVRVARPRHRPALAIGLGLLFVPALVFAAGSLGLSEARRSFEDSAVKDLSTVLVKVFDLVEQEINSDDSP